MFTIKKYIGDEESAEGKEIPQQLQCPVCFQVPEAHVFQCKNGHVICDTCLAGVKDCPQCRVPFEINGGELIRVRVLESLLDSMVFPCQHRSRGCKDYIPRKDLDDHGNNCNFNGQSIQLCQILGFACEFWLHTGNPKAAIDHFVRDHIGKALVLPEQQSPVTFHVPNLGNADDRATVDGVWSSVILSHNSDHFMVLTCVNNEEEILHWLSIRMGGSDPNQQQQLVFEVESNSLKVNPFMWKMFPISVLNCEQIVKLSPHKIPIQRLIKYKFLDKKGALKVKVNLSLLSSGTTLLLPGPNSSATSPSTSN